MERHFPTIAPMLYPSPSKAAVEPEYVGRRISEAQAPAAIIDAAVVRRNCKLMLDAVKKLGVGFRAHVKTHKTTQIAKLQVGEDSKTVKLIGSTVSEIENLLPWLLECKAQEKDINIIYGLPVSPSAIPRLAHVARQLGSGAVSLFADHPAHIDALEKIDAASWPGQIGIWVTIDVGDHREGVAANSQQLADVASRVVSSQRVKLVGVYTHLGGSYASNSPEEALEYMAAELEGLEKGALSYLRSAGTGHGSRIGISVGASPTATSLQNLFDGTEAGKKYRDILDRIKLAYEVEIHAGVYPVMDMQQLATRARPRQSASNPEESLLSYRDLGFRILAEVASVYSDRGEKPEALIAAGSIVLGREPCKSYPGWAVVTPWPAKSDQHYDPEGSKTGWIVGRTSQEHGILTWEGTTATGVRQLCVGEKLLLWPNHACIAGVNFGWYLVVDSDTDDPELIRDVWLRWRGW